MSDYLTWCKIRDHLLGENKSKQDLAKAFSISASCSHEDATWFHKTFLGKENALLSREAAIAVLKEQGEDDLRALTFAHLDNFSLAKLRKAAESGYAFAQVKLGISLHNEDEKFFWFVRSAKQNERDGLFQLAECYVEGLGTARDKVKARLYYLRSARLGNVDAMIAFAKLCPEENPNLPDRLFWLGQAARRGDAMSFIIEFFEHVEKFQKGDENKRDILFVVARALTGHVDVKRKKLFGTKIPKSSFSDARISQAEFACKFLQAHTQGARKVVDTWTMVAIRFHVVKDIRLWIAKLIWKTRDQYKYEKVTNQ